MLIQQSMFNLARGWAATGEVTNVIEINDILRLRSSHWLGYSYGAPNDCGVKFYG